MLRLLKNKEINIALYEKCLEESGNCSLYTTPAHLDIVSPNWKAIVWQEQEKYLMVMPIPEISKMGLKLIIQPFFTQQLGIFHIPGFPLPIKKVLSLLANKYPFVHYQFSSKNLPLIEENLEGFSLKKRTNYILDLNKPCEDLQKAYSSNHKRNIRKAEKNNIVISKSNDISTLIDIFKQNQGKKIKEVKAKNYVLVEKLFEHASSRGIGNIYLAKKEEEVIAGIMTIHSKSRIHYIFGTTSPAARESGAMQLIFNKLIQDYAGTPVFLDFEGSDIKGIARFFASFGALPEYYPAIYKERMPLWFSLLLKVKKWLYSLKATA
ncbi:GNAT family N-acetyltransferase [Cytophagaceae bacterium ABcell3]|nr:GNAT family N-acetyltransferase [Cytophagaceae bacterium ABcell3]